MYRATLPVVVETGTGNWTNEMNLFLTTAGTILTLVEVRTAREEVRKPLVVMAGIRDPGSSAEDSNCLTSFSYLVQRQNLTWGTPLKK